MALGWLAALCVSWAFCDADSSIKSEIECLKKTKMGNLFDRFEWIV